MDSSNAGNVIMDIAEIKKEIARLEQSETNWQNIEKLSWLYSVYDHMAGVVNLPNDKIPDYAGEFGHAISGKSLDGIIDILAEHMAVIKILHPKEYQAVIDRIMEIP
jgi:hypothetical protein